MSHLCQLHPTTVVTPKSRNSGFSLLRTSCRVRRYVTVSAYASIAKPNIINVEHTKLLVDDYNEDDIINFKELGYDFYDMDQHGNLDFTDSARYGR